LTTAQKISCGGTGDPDASSNANKNTKPLDGDIEKMFKGFPRNSISRSLLSPAWLVGPSTFHLPIPERVQFMEAFCILYQARGHLAPEWSGSGTASSEERLLARNLPARNGASGRYLMGLDLTALPGVEVSMARKSVSFAQFFHRINPDTTIDSICGYCLLTVATAGTLTELEVPESNHHCRTPTRLSGPRQPSGYPSSGAGCPVMPKDSCQAR
jgi:hypothetical protein